MSSNRKNDIEVLNVPHEIPEGWKWVKLKDICDLLNGFAFKSSDYVEISNVMNFRMSQIRPGGFTDLYHNTKYLPDSYAEIYKEFLLNDGDIVIAMTDMANDTKILGVPSIVYTDGYKLLLNQRVGKLYNISKSIDSKFLNYMMVSPYTFNYYKSLGKGGLQLNLSKADILNAIIPLPPTLAEQQRIVNRIESMFTKLDEAKEKAQNVVDSFETRKAAILHQAFTGNLTAKWRKENGVSDDLWEEKRLEDVCEFITKGTTPKKEDMSIGFGDIPYIKVYNLCFDTSLDFSVDPTFVKKESHEKFLARSITLPGDVLMNIVGPPFGKVSMVPDDYPEWNINQAIARFRCKEVLLNTYLANYLISPKTIESMTRQMKTTAGQQNLTLEICRNITISVPSVSEQQEIVHILDTVLEKERTAKSTAEQVLEQIDLLKKSILARAFRGEL